MITRLDDNTYMFTCEECENELLTDDIKLDMAVGNAKKEGWAVVYNNITKQYGHLCQSCKGNYKPEWEIK